MDESIWALPLFQQVAAAEPGSAPAPPDLPQDPPPDPPVIDRSLDKHDSWSQAFHLWLESRSSANTRRAYRKAWTDFQAFTGNLPWEVSKADVARWIDDLQRKGHSAGTIQQRLAALSSFYSYAMRVYTHRTPEGYEQPIGNINPVQAIPRPKHRPYHQACYLSVQETKALLRAIPRETVQGLRDYALFLAYLSTGRRNSEIRLLRFGDIEPGLSRTWYRWQGKGKSRRDVCPSKVWFAIQNYLRAADRWKYIDPPDYVFTPLTDRAVRLPNVDSQTWDLNRPLSMREVGRLLKKYCRRAGLDPARVHVHTLRHTAAMLRKEVGDDVAAISAFLDHSNLSITQLYLHQVEGQSDKSWKKVEALLGL